MTEDEARAIAHSLPKVEEGRTFGSIAFKVNGKVLCGIGARTGADDIYFSGVGFDETEALIERHPDIFHTHPHFASAKYILARLPELETDILRSLVERRWRELAKKADVKAWDAARAG